MVHKGRRVAATLLGAWLGVWAGTARAADYMADAKRLMAAGELPAARLQLRNAIKANPMDALAHYQLGLVDLELGDAAAAEKEALTAQDQGYDAPASVSLLTRAYLSAGRHRDLLRDFPEPKNTAPGFNPATAAVILAARGQAQMRLDHPDQAAASFAEARRLAPDTVAPLVGEAQLALGRGDLATAAQTIDAALRIDPNSAEILQLQAGLLGEKGDVAGAVAATNKAVAAAPGQYVFRLERAGLLLAFNQNAEARADVDAVLAVAPSNARAVYDRAILLLRAGDYAAANADLDKLSEFISQYPGAYYVLALVKQKMGQTEQALDAASRHAGRNPGEARGALLLAELQVQAKRPDQAVAGLTAAIAAGADDPAVYDLRGTILAQLGRPQDALKDFQKALTRRPDDPGLLARVGAADLALNLADDAASLLGRAVSLAPGQPQTMELLAMALLQSGHPDAAQKSVDQLRAQQGGTEIVGLLSGEVQLAKFNLAVARQAFEAVLHEHPDSIGARLDLARVANLQGRNAEQVELLGQVLQREPAREPVVNDMVNALQRLGKTAEAVGVLERAHDAAPANPRFMGRLAGLYISAGDPQKALALTQAPAPASQPAAAGAAAPPAGAPAIATLLIRAQAQLALKQPDAAQATYREVLAADPGLVPARIQLARLLFAAKDEAGAQAVLQDGLLADPQNEPLLKASIEIDAHGSLDAALASAARLDRDPRHQPASNVLQGDLYVAAKRFDDAARAYATALQAAPSTQLALRLASAQAAGGHADQAAEGLRRWLAQHPGDPGAALSLSELDITAQRLDSAKALLTDLVAKRPNDAVVLNNLAWVDQQSHDPQAAVLAQLAYQLAPSPQTADTWGYILATEGGGDHGVALLRLATAQAPDDPAMQYHLAVAYKAAGQPAEAVKVLTPLIRAPAAFPEKPQAQQLLKALAGGKP